MVIANVIDGDTIATPWGNSVADAVNALARLHVYRAVVAARVTIAAGAGGTPVTLTTPVIPAGMVAVATLTLVFSQAVAGVFDVNFNHPPGTVTHQVADGLNQTKVLT